MKIKMKYFTTPLTFMTTIFVMLISVTINAETYDLQLRSRTDDKIEYKTIKLNSEETTFMFLPVQNEMKNNIKKLLDDAKANGSKIINLRSKIKLDINDKNKIFLGTLPNDPKIRPDLKDAIVIRDLINIPDAKSYLDREKIIIDLEKQGVKTISSVDLLGGQAFRYADDNRPHIVVMISDDHYKADTWMPPLIEKFQNESGFYFTILHGEGGAIFHGIDEIDTADSLVIYFRRLALREDQLNKVKKFVDSGRGVVGLRTICHGFDPSDRKLASNHKRWKEFDNKILGSNYHGHGEDKLGSEISNNPELENTPILKDVKPSTWHSTGSVYFMNPVAENATVYQYAHSIETKDPDKQKKKKIIEKMPVTWTRIHGKTKIAFTALGHWDDVKEPQFQKVFLNLIKWSIDKNKD
ncbi:MAG: ThuA domain-containing protein [Planctomycetaceae bacterium]|jgi:type 1 glutamine amidotransferase|nr:ThuA domain-containing protein [Planctomycetaceae bacterium]